MAKQNVVLCDPRPLRIICGTTHLRQVGIPNQEFLTAVDKHLHAHKCGDAAARHDDPKNHRVKIICSIRQRAYSVWVLMHKAYRFVTSINLKRVTEYASTFRQVCKGDSNSSLQSRQRVKRKPAQVRIPERILLSFGYGIA